MIAEVQMLRRWVIVFAAAAAPVLASAQRALVIGGSVYEDRPALALRANFVPLSGVSVKLYRDGGESVATTTTNAAGVYDFRVDRAGDYWVVVDSRSIRGGGVWAEQTFGPARSLCGRPMGAPVSIHFEGACFGGRSVNADDASSLATAEHLAAVSAREDVAKVDFAFSFDVVTSTADGERVQGSLRQFIENANNITGTNRMRFVPLAAASEQRETVMGVPPRWWAVILGSPLPPLRDEDTILDGTAYNYLSPESVANIHPGRVGERPTLTNADPREIPRQEKPELELVVTGSEGIVCTARCGIRALAVRGTAIGVALRADARMEHVMIGASPDVVASPDRGTVGLQIERGTTIARHVLVMAQSNVGVFVGPEARLDAERLDISRCGEPLSGGGIALLSNGSSIRSSVVNANAGAGIVIGAPDGTRPANGNTIDGSTISSNQAGVVLAPGASGNVITRSDIMWNRLGGVTVAPFQQVVPRENRLSANRYDENGVRPIVLNLTAEPNTLARAAGTCERIPNAANIGISPPKITNARLVEESGSYRVVIRGKACPGEVVEIYQSFVTSGVRDAVEMPRIRSDKTNETLGTERERRQMALPSIGEFNYFGATPVDANGDFEVTFPFSVVRPTPHRGDVEVDTDIWARDVLRGFDAFDRAFSAVAIDAVGNTSEMSVRRQVDR